MRQTELIDNIHLAEFKVFSQWGDDGIIQFLVDYLAIDHKIFIEFGVADYKEANSRFLLINNNWQGLVLDGSQENIDSIKNDDIYWRYDLTAIQAFITRENINDLIFGNGFGPDIGLLHIDIDGNDFWIWDAIHTIHPVIVIVEYNSVFGPADTVTVPYRADFSRKKSHFSMLFFGASLAALCDLAESKGYCFIGCNSNGNNAYFVRRDRMRGLKALTAEVGYVQSKFRESRDAQGNMSYLKGDNRRSLLTGLEVWNTRDAQLQKL